MVEQRGLDANRRWTAASVLALILCALGVGRPADGAYAQPGKGTVVRLDSADAGILDGHDILRGANYGTFAWYELAPPGLVRLDAAGVDYERVPDATRIHINGYDFDPLDGEPDMPPSLLATEPAPGPDLYLVQLIGPTKDEWLAGIAQLGAAVVQYHAENSYAVWATATQAESLRHSAFVRWLGHYHPGYRLAPEVTARIRPVMTVGILAYEPEIGSVRAAISALGGREAAVDPAVDGTRYEEIVLAGTRIVPLAHTPGIIAINAGPRQPLAMDEMSDKIAAGMVSGSQPQGKPPSYRSGFLEEVDLDGTGTVVHINDTGVDETHNDLYGRMDAEYGNAADSHGTHVAGIILGEGYNDIGDTPGNGSWIYGLGIAPEAHYVDEYYSCSPSTCTRHAVTNDANVSSNSWGYASGGSPNYGYGYTTNSRTWDRLVQDADDVASGAQPLLIVAAAGNGGSGGETIIEPWEAKNVISVASSRNWRNSTGYQGYGNIDDISSYSSRGQCRDGRNCPVVTAPGQYIISSRYGTTGCGAQKAPNSTTHSVCSGTSMATPHVSGVASLITEWWREDHSGADPSPAMIKALVVNGAKDMGSPNIPNTAEGWGRVNVADSVDPPATTQRWDEPVLLDDTGDEWVQSTVYAADSSKPMKITLVYTDDRGPGNGGTSAAWVNNLDLKVTQGSTTYWGNHFSSGWSTSGGSSDNKNNVENVYLQSPGTDGYGIKVIAANLSGDGVLYNGDATDSTFALVCQNCLLQSPTATPTPDGSATVTPTPSPTQNVAGRTSTPIPTDTPPGQLFPSPTPPLLLTPTGTGRATDTETPIPTWTPSPPCTEPPPPTSAPSATPTETVPPTWTSTATRTSTPAPTATNTPLPTATRTSTPTVTRTRTATATSTPLPSATYTPLPTATGTGTPVPTPTSTRTSTATSTPLPSVTYTPLPTATGTSTSTPTDTPTEASTASPTATWRPKVTPVPTSIVPKSEQPRRRIVELMSSGANPGAAIDAPSYDGRVGAISPRWSSPHAPSTCLRARQAIWALGGHDSMRGIRACE